MPYRPTSHRPRIPDAAPHRPRRSASSRRGYGRRWRRLRSWYLSAHPLCVQYVRDGELRPATEVDHIVPRRLGGTDEVENLQGLCKRHHSQKTAREDGGFGRNTGSMRAPRRRWY